MESWQVPCGICVSTEGMLYRRGDVVPPAIDPAPDPLQDEANCKFCWDHRPAFGRTLRCRRRGRQWI
eukprot:7390142-Heterocapsa_arctica.AAC.1